MSKFSQLFSGIFLNTAISTSLVGMAIAETPVVDGTWNISMGNISAKLQLVQKGNTISGTFSSSRGDLPLKGSVSSNRQVSFSIDAPIGVANFEGVVDGNSMKGTAKLPRFGNQDWSASR